MTSKPAILSAAVVEIVLASNARDGNVVSATIASIGKLRVDRARVRASCPGAAASAASPDHLK
jgi:hypothetical protein